MQLVLINFIISSYKTDGNELLLLYFYLENKSYYNGTKPKFEAHLA